MRKKVRILCAGLGWIGSLRLEAIRGLDWIEVVGLSDPCREAVSGVAVSFPGAQVANSYEHLLSIPADGVVIATPNSLHFSQIQAALRQSLAVFCQKPIGLNSNEVVQNVELAKEKNLSLECDLSYRYLSATSKVRELILSQALGEVLTAHCVFHNSYGPDKQWYFNRNLSGGGCLMDLGIHLIDLNGWLLNLGLPKSSHARFHIYRELQQAEIHEPVEDFASAFLSYQGGPQVFIQCSWNLALDVDAHISWEFVGTKGTAVIRNIGGSFYHFEAVHSYQGGRTVLASPPDSWNGRALLSWAEGLRRGRGGREEVMQLVKVHKTLERLYEFRSEADGVSLERRNCRQAFNNDRRKLEARCAF